MAGVTILKGNNMSEIVAGIEYSKPTVTLLQETGIGTSEFAARTCYDSFDASENEIIKEFNDVLQTSTPNEFILNNYKNNINNTKHSDLLDKLAWTHFHYSILEHANLTYLIKGTSRAVLQEHSRHRIQAISVRSTRYTMSSVLNAFVASIESSIHPIQTFSLLIKQLDLFVVIDNNYLNIEIEMIYKKLLMQRKLMSIHEFEKAAIAKSNLPLLRKIHDPIDLFTALQDGKKKRNIGDNFKHIVTDNWKVDMVVTFNLRSLKNYFQLRDSGAAFFQIQWLAKAMKEVTPSKYLDLIVK